MTTKYYSTSQESVFTVMTMDKSGCFYLNLENVFYQLKGYMSDGKSILNHWLENIR
jgi:hypothetical protein